MTDKKFTLGLLVTTLISLATVFGLGYLDRLGDHVALGYFGIGMYAVLSILVFWQIRIAAQAENKNRFSQMALVVTMMKLGTAIAAILMYRELYTPGDKLFIVPFMLVYFIYTAFEVYFMSAVGRTHV